MWILKKKIKGKEVVVRLGKEEDAEKWINFYQRIGMKIHDKKQEDVLADMFRRNSSTYIVAEVKEKFIGYLSWSEDTELLELRNSREGEAFKDFKKAIGKRIWNQTSMIRIIEEWTGKKLLLR